MQAHTARRLARWAVVLGSLGLIGAGMWLRFGTGCALLTVGALLWIDLSRA